MEVISVESNSKTGSTTSMTSSFIIPTGNMFEDPES